MHITDSTLISTWVTAQPPNCSPSTLWSLLTPAYWKVRPCQPLWGLCTAFHSTTTISQDVLFVCFAMLGIELRALLLSYTSGPLTTLLTTITCPPVTWHFWFPPGCFSPCCALPPTIVHTYCLLLICLPQLECKAPGQGFLSFAYWCYVSKPWNSTWYTAGLIKYLWNDPRHGDAQL